MTTTSTRLRRILVVVPYILANPGANVQKVAERFEMTVEELRQDLDVLGYTGIPGYGGGDLVMVQYYQDTVEIRLADFFSKPLDLSLKETLAMLLAGRAVLANGSDGDALNHNLETPTPLATAVAKLEKRWERTGKTSPVVIADDDWGPEGYSSASTSVPSQLSDAVIGQRVVEIRYHSASRNEETVRLVEPWMLRQANGAWYLQGYCRHADAERTFRIDRIRTATVTNEAAPPPPLTTPPIMYKPNRDDLEVSIEVEPDGMLPGEHVIEASRTVLPNGRHEVTFCTPSATWAARLIVQLGPVVKRVSPWSIAEQARAIATEVVQTYVEQGLAPNSQISGKRGTSG